MSTPDDAGTNGGETVREGRADEARAARGEDAFILMFRSSFGAGIIVSVFEGRVAEMRTDHYSDNILGGMSNGRTDGSQPESGREAIVDAVVACKTVDPHESL